MDVYFRSAKLQKLCNDDRAAAREWGKQNADALSLRLSQLRAAEHLDQMRSVPQARCHGMSGNNRHGQYSVDLRGLMRLLFTLDEPYERDSSGGVDWKTVASITIIAVEDTHND